MKTFYNVTALLPGKEIQSDNLSLSVNLSILILIILFKMISKC